MNIIFAGTPPFAATALRALHAAGHTILLVLTQADKPAGRGMKPKTGAVALLADELGLRVEKPATLKDSLLQQQLRDLKADVMVVAAYGLILPQAVLDIPPLGCLNIHGSILPRWRGAAPVQRAIEAGEKETGISIMRMDAGLDTGPVLLIQNCAIAIDETSATLTEKMASVGAAAIVDALNRYSTLTASAQHNDEATYAKKILKTEAKINWQLSAVEIERRMRAFDPFPGCETTLGGETIKFWRSEVVALTQSAEPGEIIACSPNEMVVACRESALSILVVQKPNGRRMLIADYLRGNPHQAGQRFGETNS